MRGLEGGTRTPVVAKEVFIKSGMILTIWHPWVAVPLPVADAHQLGLDRGLNGAVNLRLPLQPLARLWGLPVPGGVLRLPPRRRHLLWFTLAHGAVPEGAHAIVRPQGAVAVQVCLEVPEERRADKVSEDGLHAVAVQTLDSGIAAACMFVKWTTGFSFLILSEWGISMVTKLIKKSTYNSQGRHRAVDRRRALRGR